MDRGKEKVSNRYDKWTPFYDLVDNVPLISSPQRKWKKRAVRNLDLSKGDKVLDVGTGTGQILPWIAESLDEGEVVGTDISRSMVKYAREKFGNTGGDVDIRVVHDDIEYSKFSNDYFDKIIATFTFTTIPDVERASKECARLLDPEGKMLVLDTGKPEKLHVKPFFYLMMISAKLFGKTHMDRDIVETVSKYFNVQNLEKNMMGMVYLVQCELD